MSTPQRMVLWTLALVPFLLAVAAQRQGRSPVLSIPQRDLPALAFDQYLVDLGPVEAQSVVPANFIFRNRGNRTVTIDELVPSCGCLAPRLRKKEYRPGESDALVLRVQPANESPGKHEYTVDVKYRDPQPREVRLTFRVELPEKGISVTPRALMVFQFSERETTQDIKITDTRGASWNVQGVSVNLPFVTVAVGEPTRTEFDVLEQPLTATVAAKVPSGRHHGVITVFTDDATFPELKIPLMIQGPEEIEQDASHE